MAKSKGSSTAQLSNPKSCYPSPTEKSKLSDSIKERFSYYRSEGSPNPLVGVGSDSRPHIDDNKKGANNWIKPGKAEMDAGRKQNSFKK